MAFRMLSVAWVSLLSFVAPAGIAQTAPAPQRPNTAEVTTHEETATFRTSTSLVLVPVVVRDSQGQPVGGMKQEDFQLFDRGKLQAISKFTVEKSAGKETVAPAPAAGVRPTTLAVVEPAPSAAIPDRFVAFLFDDVHVTTNELILARDAAERHLKKTADPKVRAAVFTTSGQTMLDFTDEREKWHEALARLQPRPIAAPVGTECPDLNYEWADLIRNHNDPEALFYATVAYGSCSGTGSNSNAAYNSGAPVPDSIPVRAAAARVIAQHEQEAHVPLGVLRNLVNRIAAMPGQRTLVLVSPGFLTVMGSKEEETTIIDRAIRAGVVINSLDVRGLAAEAPDISKSPGLGARARAYADDMNHHEFVAQSDVMAEVANGTGGTFFHNSNDLDEGFQRVAGVPQFIYVLGFSPQDLKMDGSLHALKVSLAPNPHHYELDARHNYSAPKSINDPAEVAKEEIREAMFSRDELREFPVELHTEYFKTSAQNARLSMVVHVDLRPLKFKKEDGRNSDDLTVAAGLFDHNGNYVSSVQKTVNLHLLDGNMERWLHTGITVPASFEVKPGAYVLRLVVRDAGGQFLSAQNGIVEIP